MTSINRSDAAFGASALALTPSKPSLEAVPEHGPSGFGGETSVPAGRREAYEELPLRQVVLITALSIATR